MYSLRLTEDVAPFFCVFISTCSILFWRFRMNDFVFDRDPNGGYALHYKSSDDRNFVMRIFVKRRRSDRTRHIQSCKKFFSQSTMKWTQTEINQSIGKRFDITNTIKWTALKLNQMFACISMSFCVVMLCGPVRRYQHFGETQCVFFQATSESKRHHSPK
jgi:hypothetical protein